MSYDPNGFQNFHVTRPGMLHRWGAYVRVDGKRFTRSKCGVNIPERAERFSPTEYAAKAFDAKTCSHPACNMPNIEPAYVWK